MKCFNCGKEVKDNLKFCTNCGETINKKQENDVEIINNYEEEGKDVASDKTAIIAICLTLILSIFVVIIGISATNRYKCIEDCDVVEPVEVVDEKEVEFDSKSEFKIDDETYMFKDEVSSYTKNGFILDDKDNLNTNEKNITLKKDDLIIDAKIVNEKSYNVDYEKYTIKELEFEYINRTSAYKDDVIELPEGVQFGDSLDYVRDIYGDYDYKNSNCYIYKYSNSDGHIELCFNNNLLNGIKIINEIR